MEINQEMGGAQSFSMLMCQRIVNSDISEDFTLPDYCPEIRRVLYVKEELPVPARFVSGNKIDVSGVVDYTLVYVNNDGEVCSAPLSAEYSFALPIDNAAEFDLGGGVSVIAHSFADNSSVRVSAPRRLQIRTRLRTGVCAWGKMLGSDNFEGLENECSLERLVGEGECADIVCESSDVITLADEYMLQGENYNIALVDSAVFVESSRIENDGIAVSGEALIKMLVICDEKNETVTRKLPFEAEIDLSGIDMSFDPSARVNGHVTDVSVQIDDLKAQIELSFVLEACVAQNRPLCYTKDIYSTDQECECQMRPYSLPVLLDNKTFSFSQSEKLSCSELNFPEGAEIIHIYGSGSVDGIALEEGKNMLTGSCKYNVICLVGGEYTHVEARVPFKYELDCEQDIDAFDGVIRLSDCKARSDGEVISFESDISASLALFGSKMTEMPTSVCFGEMREESKDRWIVYYVTPDDDLWSIAKRYGVSQERIKGDVGSDRYVMIEK